MLLFILLCIGVGTILAIPTPMIRITTYPKQDCTVVIIDGKVSPEDVPEIRRVRTGLPGKVVLNLGELIECSEEGIRLLREWLDSGALLGEANPYLRMILGTAQDCRISQQQ